MTPALDFGQFSPPLPTARTRAVVAGMQLSPVLGSLPDAHLEQLAAQCHAKTFNDGDVLCNAEDSADVLWLIIGPGWVKLSRETSAGGEAVWDVLGQSALIGLEGITNPHIYTTMASAVGMVETIVIPASALRNLIEGHPPFAMEMLRHVNTISQFHRLEMEHRTQQTAAQRVGCFFLRLARVPESGSVTFKLPFDKGLVAARLGMQPETFSRALSKLKTDTGIGVEGARVTIPDVERLNRYTCGDCSGTYPCPI